MPAPDPRENNLRPLCVVGFAGHRRLADPPAIRTAILGVLEKLTAEGGAELLGRASAAAGADLLFLDACCELGIPTTVVLPFPVERFRGDFDTEADWQAAAAAIGGARHVETIATTEGAPEVYHLAAREILAPADVMIFVWDGAEERGIGGTAETVREAKRRGVPAWIIDAETATVTSPADSSQRPADAVFSTLPDAADVPTLFAALDVRATHAAPRSRWFSAGSISLHQSASVLTAAMVAWSLGAAVAPAVKFMLVLIAGILPWLGAKLRIHGRWVEDRILAELLRSLLASHALAPPLKPLAAGLFPEDVSFLRAAAWRLFPQRGPWDQEAARYIRERLDDQISYLEKHAARAAARLRIFQIIFRAASIGAIVTGAVAIILGLSGKTSSVPAPAFTLDFLPNALPPFCSWCLAMIALFEHKRRAGLYCGISSRLKELRLSLEEARCRTTAEFVVADCERLLLAELWEWAGRLRKKRG